MFLDTCLKTSQCMPHNKLSVILKPRSLISCLRPIKLLPFISNECTRIFFKKVVNNGSESKGDQTFIVKIETITQPWVALALHQDHVTINKKIHTQAAFPYKTSCVYHSFVSLRPALDVALSKS